MRTFVILCTALISTASAASVGYSYANNGGVSFGSAPSFGGQSSYSASGPSFGSGQVGGFSLGSQGVSAPSYIAPALSSGSGVSSGPAGDFSFGSQGAVGPSYSAPAPVAPAETIKEFYTYTAPENEFSDIGDTSQITNSLKKNLRVIFIKGPENSGLEQAALQLAKSALNEQTAIYVLSKQADIGELANKFQSLNTQHSSKPQVHFIKYRTPADAENAQHAIKSQYDGLQGPTSSHSGGVAPVLNFSSNPAPQQSYVAAPVAQQGYSAGPVGNIESTYLPPSKTK